MQIFSTQRSTQSSKLYFIILLCTAASLSFVGFAHGATINVTTTSDELNDPGPGTGCSLREAIQAANSDAAYGGCGAGSGSDTIQLAAGTYTLSITGTGEDSNATGDLDLSSAIIVQGAASDQTIVDAAQLDRVFHALATDVEIHDLTATNGRAPDGGSGNDGDAGGGVYVDSGGGATIADSTISNSRAGDGGNNNGTPGAGGYGGGIYNFGMLQVTNSTISGNTAGDGGVDTGGLENPGDGGEGGGIYNTGIVILVNSTVSGNRSGNKGDNVDAGGGGGIYNATSADATLTNSTISGNITGTSGTYGSGGGIYSYGSLDIASSTISSNQSAFGGGIYTSWSNITVTNSTISGNEARSMGGGMYINSSNGNFVKLSHSTITGNTADSNSSGFGDGGGVHSYATTGNKSMEYKNTIIAGNTDNGGQYDDCRRDNSTTYTSFDYNLVGNATDCQAGETFDQATGNPLLDALADNGGPTQTHALQADSQAFEYGTCTDIDSNTVNEDQRGQVRPFPGIGTCDIGAYELNRYPCTRPQWDEGCTNGVNDGCPKSAYCDTTYDSNEYLCTGTLGCTSLEGNTKSYCMDDMFTICGQGDEAGKPYCYCESPGNCSCHADTKITLLGFDAQREGNGIRLSWQTGSEISCGVFNILRCERDIFMSTSEPTCALKDHVELDLMTLCEGSLDGAYYEDFDADVDRSASYSYYLREYDFAGMHDDYGPVNVAADFQGWKSSGNDDDDAQDDSGDDAGSNDSDDENTTPLSEASGSDADSDDNGTGCGF